MHMEDLPLDVAALGTFSTQCSHVAHPWNVGALMVTPNAVACERDVAGLASGHRSSPGSHGTGPGHAAPAPVAFRETTNVFAQDALHGAQLPAQSTSSSASTNSHDPDEEDQPSSSAATAIVNTRMHRNTARKAAAGEAAAAGARASPSGTNIRRQRQLRTPSTKCGLHRTPAEHSPSRRVACASSTDLSPADAGRHYTTTAEALHHYSRAPRGRPRSSSPSHARSDLYGSVAVICMHVLVWQRTHPSAHQSIPSRQPRPSYRISSRIIIHTITGVQNNTNFNTDARKNAATRGCQRAL